MGESEAWGVVAGLPGQGVRIINTRCEHMGHGQDGEN